jgi:iron complex outermembrane receptor protein
MKDLKIIVFMLLASAFSLQAQERIQATVIDRISLQPLVGANISVESLARGTISDQDGEFSIPVKDMDAWITISYIGYETLRFKAGSFTDYSQIQEGKNIILMEPLVMSFTDEVVVVGNRGDQRTVTSSAVPVDNFSEPVLEKTGKYELTQQLNRLAPSFYSTGLTYSDATDHMDPATLRGLNPDQTLILVNGKRHHPSAVVNTLGVVGRGSVINDLNTIPSSAIERIEILRDGASAQYGSDAIAGVINIILKEDTASLNVNTQLGQRYEGDGFKTNFGLNYGFGFENGARINFTAEYRDREGTNRAGIYEGLIYSTDTEDDGLSFEEHLANDNRILEERGLSREDFRLNLGNSEMRNVAVYINASIPLGKNTNLYAFGGINNRYSQSFGDYRLPNDAARSNLAIYPNGFLPSIEAGMNDEFVSLGIEGQLGLWNYDLSNTTGANSIEFFVSNSVNASMGEDSPTEFESGKISFLQNTVNFDINRDIGEQLNLQEFNISAGAEYRFERYQIFAGEEASWINEDQTSFPGAQGYPGYQPSDETDQSRSNLGVYLDLSSRLTSNLYMTLAGRFENYSDFGNNLSGKFAARYSPFDFLNLRGSVSTGFRAPALHQSYYSYTGSYYFGGFLYEIMTAPNSSPIADAFGISPLKEETSTAYSIGISSKTSWNTLLTVDAYQVDVSDRVVLSGFFYKFFGNTVVDSLLADLTSVGGAQFFSNAIDTRTRGIDIVLSQKFALPSSILGFFVGVNLNETEITDINASDEIEENGLEEAFFDRQSRALVELAQPKSKVNTGVDYRYKDFTANLQLTRFGEVAYRSLETPDADQVYSPRWITDVRFGYRISYFLSAYIGALNLLDVYPDENNEILESFGRFPYNTAVSQFGFNGGFYYLGLEIDF